MLLHYCKVDVSSASRCPSSSSSSTSSLSSSRTSSSSCSSYFFFSVSYSLRSSYSPSSCSLCSYTYHCTWLIHPPLLESGSCVIGKYVAINDMKYQRKVTRNTGKLIDVRDTRKNSEYTARKRQTKDSLATLFCTFCLPFFSLSLSLTTEHRSFQSFIGLSFSAASQVRVESKLKQAEQSRTTSASYRISFSLSLWVLCIPFIPECSHLISVRHEATVFPLPPLLSFCLHFLFPPLPLSLFLSYLVFSVTCAMLFLSSYPPPPSPAPRPSSSSSSSSFSSFRLHLFLLALTAIHWLSHAHRATNVQWNS